MDEAEFDDFYTASFSRLVGHLYVMTGNFAEAQDCVQEAFVRAWDHRRKMVAVESPEAWVRTVAWRIAAGRFNRAKRGRELNRLREQQAPPAMPDIEHTALVTALRTITADQRRAIVLHHLCDLSVADVAHETGVPVGTVKARLSRGRAALAVLLDDQKEAHHG
ncbi:SigE family RNA polymerase sigma factor [Nocardioides sp. JQ2195]|uniref:SigE family RNA polymerase sigma factor n=1 Tax=Nocardioides sp. JQ2195 TaxID=2592334 RepID=UPI00143EB0A6|nr:SigE family RNA polymerase sigma factor [Nocardioides sp. JQ2195]QIX28229.1 SigE family RNA polymerase sigma factor [Nocardioides sp. JQ2195]